MNRHVVNRAVTALAIAIVCGAGIGCKDRDVPPRNRLWDQVVTWAEPSVEIGPHDQLDEALRLVARNDAIRDTWDKSDKAPVESEPDDIAKAANKLIAWHAGQGGIRRNSCADLEQQVDPNRLDLLTLARGALLWAPSNPDDPRVAAVLYLGHRLRSEGHTLLDAMIGLSITADAVEWAKARKVAAGQAFRTHAPPGDLAFRAYASEAVCQVAMLDSLLVQPERARKDLEVGSIKLLGDEIERIRYFNQQLVHGLNARRGDRKAMSDFIRQQHAAASKQDDPLRLFQMMGVARNLGDDINKHLDEYEAFLAGN